MSDIRAIATILAVAAAVIGLAWFAHNLREDGAEDARTEIERENTNAGDKSDAARSAYDRCVDAGRVWDFGSGKCAGTAKGGRN